MRLLCRADAFAESLGNRLIERIFNSESEKEFHYVIVNVAGSSDPIIQLAAKDAHMEWLEIQTLLPNNLIVELQEGSVSAINADTGQVKAVVVKSEGSSQSSDSSSDDSVDSGSTETTGSPQKSSVFEVDNSWPRLILHCNGPLSGRDTQKLRQAHFEVDSQRTVCTAQTFAATRFGSTKLKSHQGVDTGNGFHPYTTPSLVAYLVLLMFLISVSCLATWSEKVKLPAGIAFDNVQPQNRDGDSSRLSIGRFIKRETNSSEDRK